MRQPQPSSLSAGATMPPSAAVVASGRIPVSGGRCGADVPAAPAAPVGSAPASTAPASSSGSNLHLRSQPSPSRVLPSSHSSYGASSLASPQYKWRPLQSPPQWSYVALSLPSSQTSSSSTLPSPHT